MKEKVYETLNQLEITYEVVEHEPVYTMEDMNRLGLPEKGTLCKNLFLRDGKGKHHYLVTLDENKSADLKKLGILTGGGKLSFASAERLRKYLGLEQGAVTPFGLMNDEAHAVEFYMDKDMMQKERLGIHPLENTSTVFLAPEDLEKFMDSLGVEINLIEL